MRIESSGVTKWHIHVTEIRDGWELEVHRNATFIYFNSKSNTPVTCVHKDFPLYLSEENAIEAGQDFIHNFVEHDKLVNTNPIPQMDIDESLKHALFPDKEKPNA